MISSDMYDTIFFARLDVVYGRLGLYLDDPSVKNIHDIRTGIRRLEAAYLLVPKRARTSSSDKLIAGFKEFFSSNSDVRDYDIIIEKLAGYGYGPESPHVMALQKKRNKKLSQTINLAKRLRRSKSPKIRHDKPAPHRFAKNTLQLIRSFRGLIPVVVSEGSRDRDLHSMRKILKRLRYVLELDPDGAYLHITSNIKHMQELLGNIHDCDIFLLYVLHRAKKDSGRDLAPIISLEYITRGSLYKSLVQDLSRFEIRA